MQSLSFKSLLAAAAALACAAGASAQEQVVKIGHSGPLSGPNTFAGRDNDNGVRLAIEELNARKISVGGKTLKFELVSEDDQCDAKTGVAVAQKFVDSGVRYVMGPYCSGVTIPASRVYDNGGTLVSTVGTNPKITQSGYKNLFRIVASDVQAGASMAAYAANVLKAKKVGVIDDRTAFGQGLSDEFAKEAQKLGMAVAGREFTNDKATDFMAILTTFKAKQPEVIFYGGYAPQAAPMARQMKQLGVRAKLLGGDTLCSPEMGKLGGDAVNDVVYCAYAGMLMDSDAGAKAFQEKFAKRFGQNPDVYSPFYYDQVINIGEAMQKSGSIDPAKVGAYIHQNAHKGVMGEYAYDDKGNRIKAPVVVMTFAGGKAKPLASY
ncbi:MAG: branched chain amino acid ABC transporter substrate-binding protein [Comamonadaceae bacterium SCN 68-20]|jgi:ABC-type branched-subunit amino acid transport system substrate-binding protein|nr:MAG: branched chain amino acid ABC transporter substrate-binding protein [Comamonadaceae bacterium SCN 68-20]OJX04325.1 MAG: branched chain amino acid ABC transporter substrate-binding protein [Burkholderiales bacterium 68-20]UJB66813.1 branched-chain amino acid ABC transporter substrate-binding protein [Acidovorax sp. YS12]